MPQPSIYFTDNFFSAGLTTIYDENKEEVGTLDLKSAFTSSIEVLDLEGKIVNKGYFPFFSRRWVIEDGNENELGALRQRLSFFSKRFEYNTHDQYTYQIKSEAFSRDYEVFDEAENLVAEFKRISGFFSSPAFQLKNQSEKLSNEELIAVVMGVSMINKRNSAAANSGSR